MMKRGPATESRETPLRADARPYHPPPLRRGANKTPFPEGTEVVVDGYQARDHNEKRANARNVTFADGRKLFLGMSGTGAPDPENFDAGKAKTLNKDK